MPADPGDGRRFFLELRSVRSGFPRLPTLQKSALSRVEETRQEFSNAVSTLKNVARKGPRVRFAEMRVNLCRQKKLRVTFLVKQKVHSVRNGRKSLRFSIRSKSALRRLRSPASKIAA
jgi:hypothetical protein